MSHVAPRLDDKSETKNAHYRGRYREELIGRRYDGRFHLALSTVGTLALTAVALRSLDEVRVWEWLALPVGFFTANGAEYFGHRYPMHRALPGLRAMCVRHAGQHHRFFTYDHMAVDEARDWHIVLFPPHIMAFFLVGIAAPVAALFFLLTTANLGWLFVVVAALYALTYEWMHLAYHLSEDSFIGRRPLIQKLRNLHRVHHDTATMTKGNFNITFPIFDVIMGTYVKEPVGARLVVTMPQGRAERPGEGVGWVDAQPSRGERAHA